MPFSRRRIQRQRDGTYRVRLPQDEREVLRGLPDQLRALLDEHPDDPSLVRLFPTAYADDPRAEAEYRDLVHSGLLDGKRRALALLEGTADNERLTEPELLAWLGAIEDLRLVLGTRLDVSEDVYARPLNPRHPDAPLLAVYGWLSGLQEEIVGALSD